MKNFKRVISMLLLLSMVLSMLPAMALNASAASYTKATSLAVGDKVIFVCESAAVELTGISTTSTKYGIGTAYTDAPAGTMVFDVVAGNAANTFAFKNSDGNYLYWTSGNSLNVSDTLSDKTSWTVTFTDGNAFVYNYGDSTRYIRWNNGSPRFACYTTTQTDIQIYKQSSGGSTTTQYAVSWTTSGEGSGTVSSTSGASGATVASGTGVTMTITPDSGSTVTSVTVNGTAQTIDAKGGKINFTVSKATTVAITWGKEAASSVSVPTGTYIVAANVDGVYYAMSETIGGKIESKVIAVNDGTVNAADAIGFVYTIASDANGYTLYNGEKYLSGGSSTNLAGSDSAYYWNLSAGVNGTYRFASVNTATRGLAFRAATSSAEYYQFGFYSLSNVKAGSTEYFDLELIPVNASSGIKTDTFVKVTDTNALGKGYYLIVCEDESRIFDGSLDQAGLEGVNTYQLVTIDDNKIVTALSYAFAIDVTAGLDQATILSSGGYYIGRTANSNGINISNSTVYTNALSIDADGYAVIESESGRVLRYNYNNTSEFFRYYLTTSTMKKVALYKSVNYMPGAANVNVNWSETGAAEGASGGTISVTKADGTSVANGATVRNGTELTLTITPAAGYTVGSVYINGKAQTIAEEGGVLTIEATDHLNIEVNWAEIILVSVDVDLKIISGVGKIEAYRNGERVGSFEGKGGQSGKLDQLVYVDEVLKLVIYPGEAYRLVAIENGGRRVALSDVTWDATLNAYVCEVVINKSSEAIGFSFLPRKTDIGVIAELATSFTPGKYVITGTTFDPLEGNSFDTKETYLLFGCDDLLASGADTIGRKAASLNLYEAGITIQNSTPYTMEGLTKGSLYDFQPYGDTGYYTIQVCGMTDPHYLSARNENELRAVTDITDQALWSVSITESGVATITNKATGRILKFAAANNNCQFRAYNNSSEGYHLPVLYKATVTGYQVNYSKEGLGSVTAYNTTTSTSVASGSIQNENSTIVFNFTPAQYNSLISVTVNGVDVTSQVVNGRLTISSLSENITVHAVFSEIVISNTVYINYFVNGTWRDEVELKELSVFSIVPDLNHTVVIDGKTYKYSDLTFEYSENLNTGAMYANPNDAIKIDDGHVINIYFLTSAIKLNKTAVQTTNTSNGTTNGGDDSTPNFSTENGQDDHGNIKQTYQITLGAQSSNWMETVTTGGNTDIIVILDNSLSMYDYTEDGTNSSIVNRDVLLKALKQFLDIVFIDNAANNRVSLISYHTTAYLHNSNNAGGYRKTQTLPTSFTYDNTFMTNKDTIYNLANNLMGKSNSESNVDAALSNDGGTTNPEAALLLAKQVAELRTGEKAKRDIIVIMFTDGKPTSRLTNDYNYTMDSTGDGTRWSGGNETSSREFNETLSAGLALKNYFNGKCKSTIYSVALLNALESSSNVNKYYTMVGYLYGAGSNARQWVGVQDNDIVPNVNTSSNWKKVTGFSDVYKPIYTNQVNVQTELSGLFESIAYTAVPGHYVTIHGSVVDVIPPQFTLTQESYDALIAAGWTITTGPNGTTLSHSNFPATYEGTSVQYEIECVGGGYGSFFTNTYATFSYNDVQTDKPVSANFYKPTVEIVPWTVDDHGVASPKTDLVIDILANDLFAEYTAGGYTIENCVITLTDAYGNPVTYLNAVEQNGDPSTYFDAVLNESNNTVTFYTETNGSYEFYYVVAATVVKPDGSKEIVYSRVTTVDVVTPNVSLNKTAQEVTSNAAYESFVETDEYGNVQQLYLITLKVDKLGTEDKVYNGIITDKIPTDFEFVKFVTPASNANLSHKDGVITWTNISATGTASSVATLQFLVRYTGNGYGSAYTNVSANFTYNFMTSDGPQTTQYFPVPAAGLDPNTVNDLDIAHSGDTNTMNVLENDLFTEDGFQLPNYPVGGITVIITDENGNPIADPEAYYGMEITVNPDGTITYTAPDAEGPIQFYYVVEAEVNLPLDSNYAEDNSTTLQSRPTMVTVYTITDKYLVVDFGYTTDGLSLLPNCDVIIDAAKGVSLQDYITFSTPAVNGAYGSASYATLTNDVTFSYSPKTMDFYAVDHFPTSLSTTKNIYVSVEREIASGVTVVPANNLFFEEDFINFGVYTPGVGDGKTNESQGTWDQGAWIVEGNTDESRTQGTANKVYGYDDTYKIGEVYSGGSSMAVTVGATEKIENSQYSYGEECGYFTFTGTGFDIYATCSRDTGVLIAEVYAYDEEMEYSLGALQRVVLIDTYFDGGEGVVFDQLPVVMCHDLEYARYTVKLRAYYHPMFDHNYVKPDGRTVRKVLGLSYDVPLEIQILDTTSAKPTTRSMPAAANGQYNVYVDSVRIYNPLTEVPTEVVANKAYSDANEINSQFTNIRDLILDAGNWTAGQSAVNGVLYIADQRAGKLNGGESGAVEDDNTIPAPAVSGFYLSPTGEMKTVVENGKIYLLDTDGKKASYNGCDIYIVYIQDTAEGQNIYYVADNSVKVNRIGYRYTENGTEKELPIKAFEDLNIVHYTSQYDAFGPKYEVHLKDGGGIAFAIPNQAYAQVSAKMADDGQAELYAYYTKNNKLDWYPVATVTSRTEMYYDLSDCIEEGMLIIKCMTNDSTSILSLCNLKTSGDMGGIAPVVDGKTFARAAFAFANKGDALEEVETQVDEKIAIGQQLYLESDLTMSFRVKESLLAGYDLSSLSLTVERDLYPTGGAKTVETTVITDYELVDGVLIFTYSGIAAAQMNDEIRVVLNIKDAQGREYVSKELVTSVTNYAKNLLEIYGSNAKLATLIMDLLNYGTAAQIYFDRHADAPAKDAYAIFADYASCASSDLATELENLYEESKLTGATASMSIRLDLSTSIGISYAVKLPKNVSAEDASVVISDAEGKILQTISLADAKMENGRYVACFYGLSARQIRDVVYATVYVNGEAISNTYAYSISTYAAQISNYEGAEKLVELTKAMVLYGDAAKAYFAG